MFISLLFLNILAQIAISNTLDLHLLNKTILDTFQAHILRYTTELQRLFSVQLTLKSNGLPGLQQLLKNVFTKQNQFSVYMIATCPKMFVQKNHH